MIPVSLEIPVNAQSEQIETHVAWRVQVIKNLDGDGLMLLNLLSSPSFWILKNKKIPNLIAHKNIKNDNIRFPKLKP
tara:strand:+ start:2000 stop:2230 length:231 start_codon:yes stop_codon:yes gene_type:complete